MTPLGHGLGRRRRGSLESEDLPPPSTPNPSRKGGFVQNRLLVPFAAALAAILVALLGAAGASSSTTRSAAIPHRIVSLSPTATESLFAIGADKQVVAVDDQSDYPKRAPRTSLSGYTPN